ncbi:AAA family ATPase [Vibrio alginolyticus]|uniref:AAA family ATPase n=1 Tax=Vibrio alginolyticus TaxID=663 RepID=UPI0023D8ABCA|nr:AAA family ATPase [Vibrio alginolyticus]WEK79855.1 AAA family ATPase [Vibrio alginolyticus]
MTSTEFRAGLKIEDISIFNLWGKDKITLPINEQVTFLTGINGSGKSTLLNIIYDSLILDPKKKSLPSTSKNRFWSSRCSFTNEFIMDTLVLPYSENNKVDLEELDEILQGNLDNSRVVKKVQKIFHDAEVAEQLTYISYDAEPRGEIWRKQTFSPELMGMKDADLYFREQEPLGFIYQEDRVSLHANRDGDKEKNLFYKSVYRSSIDDRFSHIRTVIQARESVYYKRLADVFSKISHDKFVFDEVIKSKDYLEISQKVEEIDNVVSILNSYFEASGKELVRDEENKYTLALLSDEERMPISWNLLSRGEKTIIYLFFAIYHYKDKVNVFLLDEPDTSLHVSWQENLIKDLVSIAPSNQFIIATHSPSLVMNGWLDNCLELKV